MHLWQAIMTYFALPTFRAPSLPRRRDRHPPAVHHCRPHGLLHALRLADGGAPAAGVQLQLLWCCCVLLLAYWPPCSRLPSNICAVLLSPCPSPLTCVAGPTSHQQVLNGDRLPAYQYNQDAPKAAPALKAVDLPASQFLANGCGCCLSRGLLVPFYNQPSDMAAYVYADAFREMPAASHITPPAHPPRLPCSGSSFVGEPPAGEQRIDWGPFWMGCWPFLAAILVTACYFFQAVSNGDPPGFVW